MQASLARVAQGGIPLRATERLAEEAGAGRRLFTSDLSVNEYLLARDAGCETVAQVMGTSIYHIGHIPDYKGKTGQADPKPAPGKHAAGPREAIAPGVSPRKTGSRSGVLALSRRNLLISGGALATAVAGLEGLRKLGDAPVRLAVDGLGADLYGPIRHLQGFPPASVARGADRQGRDRHNRVSVDDAARRLGAVRSSEVERSFAHSGTHLASARRPPAG